MLWNKRATSVKTVGQQWEKFAADYLTAQGLALLTQNFHSRNGELDLIMKEQDCFVFVEVKYRKNKHFGGAINAITPTKQQKILKTATFFLQQQGLNAYNTPCRFDVVAIDGDNPPEITWLKNAF